MKTTKKKFKLLLEDLKNDSNVIGAFLTGSRGKGFQNPDSDYDLHVVVKDKAAKQFKKKYPRFYSKDIDLMVRSISEFKKYATFGSPDEWDRYSFAHVKPIFDRSGKLQKIIKEKSLIPAKHQKNQVEGFLDMYFNAVYRSVKYHKKNLVASRFEAAESVRHLIVALFALEERVQPYYGYLGKELIKYPLKNFPWKPKEFMKTILKILDTTDLAKQRQVLLKVEKLFRRHGYSKVFDGWQKTDLWQIVAKS